tara:strand:+ start:306 stop:476 length:171 start_codon:yes stop_codon:yes gene_type:complete
MYIVNTPVATMPVHPCDNITNVELAIGCSTVNGHRVYSEGKLFAIAEFSEGKLQRK